MFLLEVLFLSFVTAFLRGGRIERLADLNFRFPWLLVAAVWLKFAVYFPFGQNYYELVSTYSAPRHLLSYTLIIIFLVLNLRLKAFIPAALGVFLNFAAMVANGGFMPASHASLIKAGLGDMIPLYLENGGYWNHSVLMNPRTSLGVLGDLFYLPLPAPLYAVFSLGDILIAIGVFLFVQQAMLGAEPGWALDSRSLVGRRKQ